MRNDAPAGGGIQARGAGAGEHLVGRGTKGLPLAAAGLSLGDIGRQGWNLFRDPFIFPCCIVRKTALDHNRRVMRAFLAEGGMELAPHGKTTMAPAIFAMQRQDDVWGMTAATPAHVAVYRECGISRILYANQLVDPAGIALILDEIATDETFEFLCLVDSLEGATILREAVAARCSPPIDVLVEIGIPGKRCGVRTTAEAVALVDAIQGMEGCLRLRGVEAFEGVVSPDAAGAESVRRQLDIVRAIAGELGSGDAAGRPIVSIGGSAFLQLVASELASWPCDADIVLRSGCYITHDHGMYARALAEPTLGGSLELAEPLHPAIEVWGHVLSRPERGRIIAGIGKRDISHDIDLPVPIFWRPRETGVTLPAAGSLTVAGLNDQHCWIDVPEDHPITVGDLIALGCSHPCTTFDKWRYILLADSDYGVIEAIETRF